MAFVDLEYKLPSQGTTATRVEKMYEESAAELRADLQRVDKWLLLQTLGQLSPRSHMLHHLSFHLGL